MSFKSVMLSSHLILWCTLLLLPSIFSSIRVPILYKVLIYPHLHQYFIIFLRTAILAGMRISYCGFDLCVSLKMKWTSEISLKWHWVSSHILLDIYICSLEKCLFKSLAHFKIRFFFSLWSHRSSLSFIYFGNYLFLPLLTVLFVSLSMKSLPRPMSRGSSSMFFLGILQFQVLCLSL